MSAMPGMVAELGESGASGAGQVASVARLAMARSAEAGGLDGLVSQLQGVPKGALKTVLGNELGARVWRQARGESAAEEGAVPDAEVVAGMIGHLSQRAGEELRKNERQAKFVRLTVCYQDGTSGSARARLASLTQDASEMLEASMRLFKGFEQPAGRVRSVNLDVTVAAAAVASKSSPVPGWVAMPVRAGAG
jgi:hypothetical protein